MCVTDHHDMTLAVKVALNPNTTNQNVYCGLLYFRCLSLQRTVAKFNEMTIVVIEENAGNQFVGKKISQHFLYSVPPFFSPFNLSPQNPDF